MKILTPLISSFLFLAISLTSSAVFENELTGDCDSAIQLVSGETTIGSSCDGELCTTLCEANGIEVLGTWYRIYSESCSSMSFNLTNVSAETVSAAVYAQPASNSGCDGLETIACCPAVEATCAGDIAAIYTIQPDTWIYVMVYTPNGDECGDFSLSATCEHLGCTDPSSCNFDPDATLDDGSCEYELCGPENDEITGSLPVICGEIIEASTGGSEATFSFNTPDCHEEHSYGIWYTFMGTGEWHTLSTCGSASDSQVHIFNTDDNTTDGVLSCAVDQYSGLQLVEIDDADIENGCGFFEQQNVYMQFLSEPGTNYFILVSAPDQFSWGAIALEIQCEEFITGCTNESACNYDSAAILDDNSCDFFSCACGPECPDGMPAIIKMYDEFGDGWNGASYTITLQDDTISTGSIDDAPVQLNSDNFIGPEYGEQYFCFCEESCYQIVVIGGSWDSEISWEIFTDEDFLLAEGVATTGQTIAFGDDLVCGCDDPGACNFDPLANSDPGVCEYEGCIVDGDLNGDGVVNTEDVLDFIADWGCEGEDCLGDINADGLVNTLDLMILLVSI